MTVARAFWIETPGQGGIRCSTLRDPGADEVRVRTFGTAVSAGTERLVFEGRVPATEWERMRAPLQEGTFPAPVKYGYAAVGRVEAGAAALLGKRVFCLHPHQDFFVAPARMAVPLPEEVPDARAVLGANMETALNAVWDAAPLAGERIAVVGAGVVGLLVAYLLRRHGHRPIIVDRDEDRTGVAGALALDFGDLDVAGPFDLVVHASGNPDGLVWALDRLDFEGRIVELSWYGDRVVGLPLGGKFHSRRLKIISSQVGAVAPPMRGRLDHGARLAAALALLDDPRLDALVDAELPLCDLPAFMQDLAAGKRRVLCARITYDTDKR